MRSGLTVELFEFTVIEGISEESLLKAIHRAQSRFFKKQKGFIRGEVLRKSDQWIKITYWHSKEEAEKAYKEFLNHTSSLPFCSNDLSKQRKKNISGEDNFL